MSNFVWIPVWGGAQFDVTGVKYGNGFEFSVNGLKLTFKNLVALSEWFGTTEIDIDHSSGSGGGCSTCGWGSDDGDHVVTVYNATKNVPVF